jgi:hypothetical protein
MYFVSGGYELHSSLPVNYTNTPPILLYLESKNQLVGLYSSVDICRLPGITEVLQDLIKTDVEQKTFTAALGWHDVSHIRVTT